jgi:hypothetical protein
MTKENPQLRGKRVWACSALVVALAVLSLTVSLATRTFHDMTASHRVSVRADSQQAMRQHLNKDAAHWPAPVFDFAVLDTPTFYPRVAPAGPPIPSLHFDESLYNRPPPTC